MKLIRYQSPEWAVWPAVDRFSDLETLFDLPSLGNFEDGAQSFTPALDLYQNSDHVVAVVELPGMKKEAIEISLHEGTLTISGERKHESVNGNGDAQKPEHRERFFGKFRRTITLPERIDAGKVSANYRDGILTVTLPKAEEAKPKQIQVEAK